MDIFERKQKILEILNRDGKVRVNELSALFDISDVTIRMDLADLEAKGLLSRVHGGAVSSYKTYYNMDMQQRLTANQTHKQAYRLIRISIQQEPQNLRNAKHAQTYADNYRQEQLHILLKCFKRMCQKRHNRLIYTEYDHQNAAGNSR